MRKSVCKNGSCPWLLLAVWLAGTAAGPTRARAQNLQTGLPQQDTQIWCEGQAAIGLRPGLDAIGSGGIRVGRSLEHLVYERAGAGLNVKMTHFLNLTPSYHYIAVQPYAGRDSREHRLVLDGTISWRLLGFAMSDRNRLERRFLPVIHYSRYRNRLQIQHPVRWKKSLITLALADEVYYDGVLARWPRNRFYATVSRRVSGGLTLEFYYVRQNDHYAKPGDINAFGINFKLQARKFN